MNSLQPKQEKINELAFSKIYTPHTNQLRVHTSSAKYRVVDAGRRFGKSALALNEGLLWLLDERKKRQMVWIILPEYKQARTIYWIDPDIVKYYMPFVQAGIFKKNDSDLSLYCKRTESWLFLKGSDNFDSLRGSGLDLIIWDEVADVKPDAFNVISPTLADSPFHRVLYMGTPDGYNHFHDFALRGDKNNLIEKAGKQISLDSEWETFKFTSYDNMAFPEGSIQRIKFIEYLDKERQKYREQGLEDWFEQEYMAEFRKRAGAVHKLFDRNLHVIPNMELPKEWRRGRGWDWGSSHPTASLRIAIDNDDNWFVELCYKQKDRYIEQHAEEIKKQDHEFLLDTGEDPIPGYGDPSGAGVIKEFNKLGFHIVAAKRKEHTEKKTWIEFAIDIINSKIAPKKGHTVFLPDGTRIDDAPSFFILNNSENEMLVGELETLAYKKTEQGIMKTEIDDTQDIFGHYDLHASLRYFSLSQGMSISWTTAIPTKQPSQFERLTAKPKEDLRDEETRKRLELEADLAIMKAAQGGQERW